MHVRSKRYGGPKPVAVKGYNFDVHERILMIFGKNVAEKLRNKMMLYSHLTSACLARRKREMQKIASFLSLNSFSLVTTLIMLMLLNDSLNLVVGEVNNH